MRCLSRNHRVLIYHSSYSELLLSFNFHDWCYSVLISCASARVPLLNFSVWCHRVLISNLSDRVLLLNFWVVRLIVKWLATPICLAPLQHAHVRGGKSIAA